jgi:predicted DNA-binding mobile mystery protein A
MAKSNVKSLKLRQLTNSIKEHLPIPIARLGQFLKNIRETVGMTQKQMAKKLKVNQSVISRIEDNIQSCTLKTISKVVNALECEFMGLIISKVPLDEIIRKRAEQAAKKILDRTFGNMAMEKQMPSADAYKYQFRRYVENFVSNPGPELWED